MLGEENNLKDAQSKSPISYGTGLNIGSFSASIGKTNKLITALYMVTDILEKDEPLRNKLRTLGADIVSDIHAIHVLKSNGHQKINRRIGEIVSFLDIGHTIGVISEMNSNILKKEFFKLKESIEEAVQKESSNWLEEFISKDEPKESQSFDKEEIKDNGEVRTSKLFYRMTAENSQGQSTRLGIQKGSTLLKALKEISVSDRKVHGNQNQTPQIKKENPTHKFDLLKKTRREEILKIVKEKKEVSIKDIVSTLLVSGSNISEKTIQRELVSMVSDSLLYRTGEKRWARYSIK